MSGAAKPSPNELPDTLQDALQLIEKYSVKFPVSQVVSPLADVFDWLLDEASTEEQWVQERRSLQRRYADRWKEVSSRSLQKNPRRISNRALENPDYDPLSGSKPWGRELTHAFRAALAEVEPVVEEAPRVLPDTERMRAFARALNTTGGRYVLPVVSYAALEEVEWEAILARLNEIIELALAFEGAVVVWLVGSFFRDPEGRLKLRPQVSLPAPSSGTRVKPVHVLIGTQYEAQCPTLLPRARKARGNRPRPSDPLLRDTPWHRVVVQLDIAAEEYELLDLNRVVTAEKEIARQVMYLDQQTREPHVLQGTVLDVPRPEALLDLAVDAARDSQPAPETRILPPRPAPEPTTQSMATSISAAPQTATSLHADAEDLRNKGMAAVASNPAMAQKYLLASTVLENSSVDVWLTLESIATGDKQKEAFRREADKVLKRQRQDE